MFEHAPAQVNTAPAQIITAPAQLITAPAQPSATGVVMCTALFSLNSTFCLISQDRLEVVLHFSLFFLCPHSIDFHPLTARCMSSVMSHNVFKNYFFFHLLYVYDPFILFASLTLSYLYFIAISLFAILPEAYLCSSFSNFHYPSLDAPHH